MSQNSNNVANCRDTHISLKYSLFEWVCILGVTTKYYFKVRTLPLPHRKWLIIESLYVLRDGSWAPGLLPMDIWRPSTLWLGDGSTIFTILSELSIITEINFTRKREYLDEYTIPFIVKNIKSHLKLCILFAYILSKFCLVPVSSNSRWQLYLFLGLLPQPPVSMAASNGYQSTPCLRTLSFNQHDVSS